MTAPGPVKLGRYELITRIGAGGMAEVQLALQRGPAGFEKLVVVKLVHENLATQKTFVDMLLDEARVAALVKHPNVVDIYDLGEAEGRYFIAMEYLEGEPMLAVLRAGRDGQRLDVLSTARLVADTAEGLDAAHELRSLAGEPIELVHHDVSLGNIVVLYNGQVKLVDFGVAKASQSAGSNTRIQGKFGYMAPEKLRGAPGDRRSDIWSLGIVLWEALTLRRLFKGSSDSDTMQQVLEHKILAPSAVNGDVPADFDPIVLRALERDPALRYPTAKAMAADLEDVLRKHGYAAKNDQIARHMQSTFASHIAARKKLLQEVSSKGLASPDVVEAAFHDDSAIASGTPILPPSDAWMPHRRGDATEAAPRHDTARAAARGTGGLPIGGLDAGEAREDGDDPTELAAAPLPVRRRRLGIAIAGAAVLVAGVVIAVMLRRDQPAPAGNASAEPSASAPHARAVEPSAAPVRPVAGPVAGPAPVAAEPAPAAAGSAPEPARAAIPEHSPPLPADSAPIAKRSHVARVAQSTKLDRPADKLADKLADKPMDKPSADKPDKLNVDEVFKAGLQAWVRGDSKSALASYKRVIQSNAGFAPAWRGLGLVHEKLGDRTAARVAFQKYLQLAPTAGDAASIRARIDAP